MSSAQFYNHSISTVVSSFTQWYLIYFYKIHCILANLSTWWKISSFIVYSWNTVGMEISYPHQICSRGWYVYGKSVWMFPKKGERVFAQKEKDPKALLSWELFIQLLAWGKINQNLFQMLSVMCHRRYRRLYRFFIKVEPLKCSITNSERWVGNYCQGDIQNNRGKEEVFGAFERNYR